MENPQLRQILGSYKREIEALHTQLSSLQQQLASGGLSNPLDEINKIPGRRVSYLLVGTQTFTTSQDGVRGSPINCLVSQDGAFVWTHYPIVMWNSTLPTNATDFGIWRPVYTWPLPDQVLDTNLVDISYEVIDAGSQRNLQNLAAPPLLSNPAMLHPLPFPTLFAPNTTVQFVPTYNNIAFGGSQATTQGTLYVAFPGYKIVSM